VGSLNNLRLTNTSTKALKKVMDLALNSSSPTFSLSLERPSGSLTAFFEHDLMQRVIDLHLSTGKSFLSSDDNKSLNDQ
jgi:hypothetical protein